MTIETEAEKRYARAYEAAVQIIHETREGLRNEKMEEAVVQLLEEMKNGD